LIDQHATTAQRRATRVPLKQALAMDKARTRREGAQAKGGLGCGAHLARIGAAAEHAGAVRPRRLQAPAATRARVPRGPLAGKGSLGRATGRSQGTRPVSVVTVYPAECITRVY